MTYIHPMDRRDPNWMSAADESRQEVNEHLESKSRWQPGYVKRPWSTTLYENSRRLEDESSRKQYRATSYRAMCLVCNENIRRGMPVVYVRVTNPSFRGSLTQAIHARCESTYDLSERAPA